MKRLLAIAILLCAAAGLAVYWQRHTRALDAAGLMQCLPQDQSTHVYLDVASLRRAGILDLLAGSKTAEDADYRTFVQQTGFDYRTDLDAVAAAFMQDNVYLAVRGRFDQKKLEAYAASQGGHCPKSICEMPASTPGRNISFYSLQPGVLAMAVSKEPLAVTAVGPQRWRTPPRLPADPVWISAPAFVFSDVKNMPAGTHSFLSPLAQAQNIVFTAGPQSKDQGNGLELRLDIACNSPEDAAAIAKQLADSTDLLRKMLVRESMVPRDDDLSGVLVSGQFAHQGKNATGLWPIRRQFIEALFSGKIE